MPNFIYEAIDREGKLRSGQAEALEEALLQRDLTQQGFFVVNIRRSGSGISVESFSGMRERHATRAARAPLLRRLIQRIRITDLVLFSGQLAAMTEGGLQLVRSLKALAAETPNRRFSRVIDQVASDVEAGSTFADALGKHPWAFSNIFVSLTRVGEAASQLPATLNQLTVYLEKSADLRRKIIGALSYPLLIFSVTCVVFLIVVIKIVPIFEGVYNRLNSPLPVPTRMLLAVSQAIRSSLWVTLLIIALVAVAFYFGVPAERWRYRFDRFKLRLPMFGRLIRKAILAKVCRTLSTLIQSGVPLLEALDMSAEAAGNRIIENAIYRSIARVREGGTVADALRESGEFPSLVTQMVGTGEESGQLAPMLAKAATYYEQQVDATTDALSTLIEPILIVVVGVMAGLIFIALYLPIFNLGGAIRGIAR
ncbi:MAG: type II secretion system F family protein [Deltaproteobacteria bacterium]|nr:type II secretion system F family protein [Deltaproteobacteria bacterium]